MQREGHTKTVENEIALKCFKKNLNINPNNLFIDEMIEKLDK